MDLDACRSWPSGLPFHYVRGDMMVSVSRIWKLCLVYSIVLFVIIRPDRIGWVKVQEGGGGLWVDSRGPVSLDELGWP